MKRKNWGVILIKLVVPLLCLAGWPALVSAQTCIAQRFANSTATTPITSWATSICVLPLTCTVTATPVQDAVNATTTANVVKVTGTCSEDVLVREEKARITLDGQGSAALVGDPTTSTIQIRGSGITIRDFLSISGGSNGILVSQGGTATIINNTIESNSGTGIAVQDGSSARIGFSTGNDTVASPNIIQNNTDHGIRVSRTSGARIIGNTISNNGAVGVLVTRVSQADISANTINGSGTNGIVVTENSGVTLGSDTGTTIFDLPNSTTANNTGFGVSCANNSSADGRVGTVGGASGQKNFSADCTDSLIP